MIKLKVKVLEIKVSEQKIRVGQDKLKQIHLIGLKIKKLNKQLQSKLFQQTLKGLIVRPEGCEMDFPIKKI